MGKKLGLRTANAILIAILIATVNSIVHKKVYEWKDKGRVKKEGPTPFFPLLFIPSLTVLPFVPFSYGQRQCFFV
jgi:hypothetical protein